MSADHLLYQMGHPGQNDWFDFDNSFDYASGYLDCAPDAVNSISPEDYSLPFNDLDTFPDLVNFDQAFDEAMKTTPAPMSGTIPMFGDATMSPDSGLFPDFDTSCQQNHFDWTSSLRDMVDARAAADPSCLSTKEKRRDAGIAVHLQRLHDVSEREVSSDSNTSFSSPSWSNFVRDSTSPTPQSTSAITSFSAEDSTPMSSDSDPTPGGMELVLDLNMNAPSNLPKKQKPRSLAQKENYIKARKYGACEKHRKQHKRCNCLEKNASRIAATTVDVPRPVLQAKGIQPGRSPDRSAVSKILPVDKSPRIPQNVQTTPSVTLLEARRPIPSARRSVDGNPAPPGLQTRLQPTQPRPLSSARKAAEGNAAPPGLQIHSQVTQTRRPLSSARKAADGNTAPPGLQTQLESTKPRRFVLFGNRPLSSAQKSVYGNPVPLGWVAHHSNATQPRYIAGYSPMPGLLRRHVEPCRTEANPGHRHEAAPQRQRQLAARPSVLPEKPPVGIHPSRNILPGSPGKSATHRISEYAGQVVHRTGLVVSSLTSWIGVCLRRAVIAGYKQHLAFKKSLELDV